MSVGSFALTTDLCTVRLLRHLLILITLGYTPLIHGQVITGDTIAGANAPPADTLDWRHRHSTRKAALLSAVLPGAGQIYNRKYWKAPIVWTGLGVSLYFIGENNMQYQRYKDAYLANIDGDPNTVDEFNGKFSPSSLLDASETYRKWRDLSYIALGAVYLLNVVDASVDANFVRFDVGRDLSFEMGPSLPLAAQGAPGFSMALTLR